MLQLSEKTLGDWLEYWAATTPDKERIYCLLRPKLTLYMETV